MVGNLRRNTLQKNLHLGSDLINAVHNACIHHIGRNHFFSWKSGYTVDSNYLAGLLVLVCKTPHYKLQPLPCTGSDLKVIALAHLAAYSFIHLPSPDGDLLADNDPAPCDNGKIRALGTDIHHHASLIVLQIHAHGNGICNGCLHHIDTVLAKPVAICHLVISPFLNGSHVKRDCKIHNRAYS